MCKVVCTAVWSTLSEIAKIFSTQVMLNIDIYVQLLIVVDCSVYRVHFQELMATQKQLKVNWIFFFLLLLQDSGATKKT